MKSFSEFESVNALLEHRGRHDGQRVAVVFEGRRTTYAELEEGAARVQTWLQSRGVGAGDAVALLMTNSLEFLLAWLGVARAGAVGVPVNTSCIGEALHYTLRHSDAIGVIADAALLPALDDVPALPDLGWRVCVGGAAADAVPFSELLSAPAARAPVRVGGLDPMNIIYTSGTTGMPKGVVLSHTSYVNTGAYWVRHFQLTRDDVLHTCLPLFHCNAQQTTFMGALTLGATMHLHEKFSVSRFWSWIEESQATITSLLGAMLVLLSKSAERPGDADNPLRYINGAPLPAALHAPLEARFGVRLVEGYGLTETGTMATLNPLDDRRPGTFGLPLAYTELRIVDEHDVDVGDGVSGEILTRSLIEGAFMTGYHKEPDKTAEAMENGWFHSGDAGMRRSDGYFVFLDRMKDTIRRRGENISSFLLEKIISEHPELQEVAAIGVPSELSEDDVKVVCVRQPDASVTEAGLSAWCMERVPDFMRPRYIEFRESLPRTETGRVQKFELRRRGAAGAWDRESAAGAP